MDSTILTKTLWCIGNQTNKMSQDEAKQTESAKIKNPTFGQKAVGINFNQSNLGPVDRAKQTMANAIDQMNEFRNSSDTTPEQKRLASIAITELQGTQMWMVKALTWKD